ncbi:MAG: hypothetical protein K0R50_1645 [Eubacterium sp.]|jgi:sulfite exporter TauE/SafE/copper chaperone CopZ|nr:hypothetical protein [Eubacterium sp.]
MDKNLIRRVLHIDGMTCTGCETRIENALKKLEGVEEAKAIFNSANVYVTYDANTIKLDKIIEVIEKLDYRVMNNPLINSSAAGNGKKNDENKKNIGQIIGAGIIIFALYTIINNTVGFNFIPQVNQSMGYGILFVVGLLTSLHCIAMCGGINLSVCVQYNSGRNTTATEKLKPSLLYNLGRVISYTTVGGIVGAIGSVVSFSGTAKGIVAVVSGIFMIIMGLNMLNIFPWLRKLNPRLPKFLGTKIHSSAGGKGPLFVGLLNGLMPCGPLQAMQLYALGTGSFTAGAISMFLFSLGTVPLMFGFGAVSSFLSGKFTKQMLKVSAVLVMVLGLIMMNRGLNLSGLNFMGSVVRASTVTSNTARVEDGIQVVTTGLEAGRYTPITVQKGIPVRWTIQVEEGDLNGCNNPVTIPEFNIQKKLVVGDNIIEFTPEKEGNIVYTCWMGMISSNIKVVADVSNVSEQDLTEETRNQVNDSGAAEGQIAGGCCAAGSKATEFYNGNIPVDDIAVGKIVDGVQTVTVNVNDYGYSPAVAVIQKGVKTNLIFISEKLNSCNNRILFPEYGAGIDLKEGENKLEFIPDGDFHFNCWMGMLNGYIKVVDDINTIDLDIIRDELKDIKPAAGAGGDSCCG